VKIIPQSTFPPNAPVIALYIPIRKTTFMNIEIKLILVKYVVYTDTIIGSN